jgi:3-hydroxybutyryl-CoA dehydrogenase
LLATVAIIGAGPLGRWLALSAARAGFSVLLEDVMPTNLRHARESLRQQLGTEALTMVNFVSTIEDAVRDADLVIDCVPDELESKLEILWLLDRMAPPRTVFATPTVRLSIADLASCTYRPEKCIAMAVEAGPPRKLPREPSTWFGRFGSNWGLLRDSLTEDELGSRFLDSPTDLPVPQNALVIPDVLRNHKRSAESLLRRLAPRLPHGIHSSFICQQTQRSRCHTVR